MATRKRPIEKITVEILYVALRMADIKINKELLDKIIDIIELLEIKGGKTNTKDMCQLKAKWKESKT